MKSCTKCNQTKNAEEFCQDKSRPDGRFPWCKSCHAMAQRKRRSLWTEEERRMANDYTSLWRANRDANVKAREEYLAQSTLYTLKSRYGITPQNILDLAEFQNKQCAICGCGLKRGPGFKAVLHIDHNHETGEIRGLLCGHCNTGLGQFKDSVESLRKAIEYLSNPPSRKSSVNLPVVPI